jgi:NAD-dependent dihydropyrimidine dehydrogenase PreA subunit
MANAVSIDEKKCSGCRRCHTVCPTDVFAIGGNGKAYVAFGADCHVCFLCVDDCPEKAISLDPSVANARQSSIYADFDASALVYVPERNKGRGA